MDSKVGGYTAFLQPLAAATIILRQITTDWWKALLSRKKLDRTRIDDRLVLAIVRSPYVQANCAAPQNLSSGSLDVQFPTLSPDGWEWREAANFTVSILNTTAANHLRFHWVHLPDQFGAATIGSVFESPWASDNSSRAVIGCFAPDQLQNPDNGRIGVNETWLELLTPPTPSDAPGYYLWQPSTIESVMMNAGLQDTVLLNSQYYSTQVSGNESSPADLQITLLETIISSVFADGLSRSGSAKTDSEWQDAFNPPLSQSGDVATLEVSMQISGFTYQGSPTEYLAMAALFVHIVFALSHTIWILTKKETSTSWDSVSKLLVLAQNPRPIASGLKNASANIKHLQTYSQKAKIRATQPPGYEDYDHVELIFFGEHKGRRSSPHFGPIEGVDMPMSDIPANGDSIQADPFEQRAERLQFNDQHRYPQT
ncbi:hypothetical protein BDZ45DRAFT_751682 [Acephala macrosclerotiorum]|nr:hypothetical protein BDZ45DRAFT_751682 [Acephala macrosclerotiorum]